MAKKKKRKAPPQYKSGPKKGQFMSKRARSAKKAAKKSKPAKRKSTALAKRGKTTSMAKGKKKYKKRGNPNGGGLMRDKDLMVGGAIYGFISKPSPESDSLSASFQEQTAKLPEIGNRDVTNGLALYFIDRYLWKNRWLRETSRAALTTGAVDFGRKGFTLGDGGSDLGASDDLSGALDVTEEGEELSGVMG